MAPVWNNPTMVMGAWWLKPKKAKIGDDRASQVERQKGKAVAQRVAKKNKAGNRRVAIKGQLGKTKKATFNTTHEDDADSSSAVLLVIKMDSESTSGGTRAERFQMREQIAELKRIELAQKERLRKVGNQGMITKKTKAPPRKTSKADSNEKENAKGAKNVVRVGRGKNLAPAKANKAVKRQTLEDANIIRDYNSHIGRTDMTKKQKRTLAKWKSAEGSRVALKDVIVHKPEQFLKQLELVENSNEHIQPRRKTYASLSDAVSEIGSTDERRDDFSLVHAFLMENYDREHELCKDPVFGGRLGKLLRWGPQETKETKGIKHKK